MNKPNNSNLHIVDIIRLINMTNTSKMCVSMAPGKKDHRWDRNLVKDLSFIKGNNIGVVVCLLEWSELDKLHMLEYPTLAQQNSLIFYHLQIKDGKAPKQNDLKTLIPLLVQHLISGVNILVHCRAGLGRAGTICACCLCYFGYDPISAIHLVRERRPRAIQTIVQENCIIQYYNNLQNI